MKKCLVYFLRLLVFQTLVYGQNQGINNLWYMGYGYSSWGLPYGQDKINFFSGSPVIAFDTIEMDFDRTHANISDSSGNMLFYTNGYSIADATDQTMQNGSGISPSGISTTWPYGLVVPQACLIIPKPGSGNLYYLFHSTVDNPPNYTKAHYLYYSIIDMNGNGGLGAVTTKNQILIQDTLNAGKITACRHANGRDWWVVCHRFNSNVYYNILVDSSGTSMPVMQAIGSIRDKVDLGQVAFSPDGNKFAYFNAFYTSTSTLDIYDFDRCTGLFSNVSAIIIPQSTSLGGGLAFSPNSKYLYISNIDSIYQFDVTSSNIAASKITVAIWDSFYSPGPPFATLFDQTQLAADGKIYIGTGNGTLRMHVINYPDSVGVSCYVQQHSIILPAYSPGAPPNHPNYFLGCDTTSGCSCLLNLLYPLEIAAIKSRAGPNPNNGVFTLQFSVQKISGFLKVYDVYGNLVHDEYIAQWSQYKQVNIIKEPNGIYFCKMNWNSTTVSVKVIKE